MGEGRISALYIVSDEAGPSCRDRGEVHFAGWVAASIHRNTNNTIEFLFSGNGVYRG